MTNYPEKPKETFVKYVELSAQHPEIGKQLQLASAHLHWFQYHSIDVILFLVLGAILLVAVVVMIFRLPRYLLNKSKEHEEKEKEN
jgi:hypothetical protein